MKKKYFAPEMEEVEVENMELLVGSPDCEDEKPKDGDIACPGESVDDM
jgi:hypothetical protein